MFVDISCLRFHDGFDRRIMAPSRSHDDARHKAGQREDLIQGFKAFLFVRRVVHAADDIRRSHGAWVEIGIVCECRSHIFQLSGVECGDDQHAIIIVGCRVIILAKRFASLCHFQLERIQKNRILDGCHAVCKGERLVLLVFLVLLWIQYVHQHDRRAVIKGELAVDRFAQGVVFPVIRIAEGCHCLCIGIAEDGTVRFRRIGCQVQGRRPENDGQACIGFHWRDDTGGNFASIYAMFVCHV